MVDTLIPYDTELRKIKQDLPNILRKILIKHSKQVIDILRVEQLGEGIDSKGKTIGKYKYLTQQYAEEERQASGGATPRQDKTAGQAFNFEWTGGLFDGMYLHFEDMKSYSLFSQDGKAKYLEKQYGDIYTLTKENNERVNQEILYPNAWEEIIRRFGNI